MRYIREVLKVFMFIAVAALATLAAGFVLRGF